MNPREWRFMEGTNFAKRFSYSLSKEDLREFKFLSTRTGELHRGEEGEVF
jgi:hypothetical protein